MNAIEDETVKLAELNSSNRAAAVLERRRRRGDQGLQRRARRRPRLGQSRARLRGERTGAVRVADRQSSNGARALRMLYQAISASSEDELAGFIKDLGEKDDVLAKTVQQAAPQASALGVSVDDVTAQTDRFIKALAHASEIVARGRQHQSRDAVGDGRPRRRRRDDGRARRLRRPGQEDDGRIRPRKRPRTPARPSSS